jgi:outer membrane protein assembly factor BamB
MSRTALVYTLAALTLASVTVHGDEATTKALLDRVGSKSGICVFLGLPDDGKAETIVEVARASELFVYVQTASTDELSAMRKAADEAGLLGKRIWVDEGSPRRIQMADNVADAIFVGPSARGDGGVPRDEVLRVLHPRARGVVGTETIAKPVPKDLESWSHPYHGPDNNPNSNDRVARHPYLTQFLGEPMFGCISEVTVAAGGRIFKAFGHIAFKEISNEVLNTLYAINAYNGTILWKRKLKVGFMIHRNTMVATPDTLYLADDESCKLIDARTGEIQREIRPPAGPDGGTVWKWMALEGNVLYAMLGGDEVKTAVQRGGKKGYGGWPWGMWKGYDYKKSKTSFGFGRTLLAIDAPTGKVIWRHEEDEELDGRALCMRSGKIYAYAPDKFLMSLDTKTGKPLWKTHSAETLGAIGNNGRAQGYIRGFSTTAYMKCNDDYLFFAGPQRSRLAVLSAKDGSLAWTHGDGNQQLVLRDDAVYSFGGERGKSHKLEYDTGKVLAEFDGRRACTRATGSIDSLFCRTRGGTIRLLPGSAKIEHIAPMRPACHDGVLVSEGYLYWGPWICACQLALFGHIGLGPAGAFDFNAKPNEKERLTLGAGSALEVAKLEGDRAPNKFEAGDSGAVVASRGDRVIWKAYTGSGINFPPVTWNDRVYVGSNDGRVYAFEAMTGRLLWRFRAAPEVRRIHVYGDLMSTWPVAGGVAVKDGTLYAAAGIAHFDGTHVYALDAITGKIRWHNGDSGTLNPELKNGISLCGQISIQKSNRGVDVLRFHGGNAVDQAVFDLKTGKCLTGKPGSPRGVTRSTFYVDRWLRRRAN